MTTLPQALFFDVFGTVVEWRESVTTALQTSGKKALEDPHRDLPDELRSRVSSFTKADWLAIAEEWRKSYGKFTRSFDASKPFVSVDQHHHTALQDIFKEHGIRELFTDDELKELTLAWHRLNPWPDSSRGLEALNNQFITSTLSNGNVSLLEDLQEYGNLPFTHLISSENFGAYKPSPQVYLGAAKLLQLEPSQCALVAAHLADLEAARKCGFQTIYVEREKEEEWTMEKAAQAKADGSVDMWVNSGEEGLIEIARRFGVFE
ncbi:hypothetical protein POX_f08186 [Penicillium oxalicum]|uniref:Haloacid dehalogenase, type II n=1 Tax=Penicillium oxalicum (strain 114-2 / CGMCC 5302) TaxID=933388 RepID=S7ZKB8_PENO1|nr:hypothetical protein POX_f08186 [Penicillium oxalicum]EPS29131.1 hypothetical protein PDE_04080 [Penicillium oxalicum 114-2]KAI2787809.1 hypothetical protein POX_f08186 [Penicillium oxalicum]